MMRYIFTLFLMFFSASAVATPHPEQRLFAAIADIQSLNINRAESRLRALISEIPDFKLAQLVYADLLLSRVKALDGAGSALQQSQQKKLLLSEIKNRYLALNDQKIIDKIPSVLARIDDYYRHAIVIDLSKSRLYLFDNSQAIPVLVKDFFISMGRGGAGKLNEGDLKTPLGVYFVQSYISPGALADKYGAGAYPINYPNAWDRLSGKTGHGIWLHGTRSGTYNRPLLASEGCVVLPNDDLLNLGAYIDLKNTPVLIGESIEWMTQEKWLPHQKVINQIQAQWKADWESLNVENYLSHYSIRFSNGKKNFYQWSEHKRRIAKHKTFVNVDLSNVSLLMHPQGNVLVATFLQNYVSDNFISKSWKRQYWNREDDGVWRIVFEGKISTPVERARTFKPVQASTF